LLQSYSGQAEVGSSGATLAAAIVDLDRIYPGIRSRMIDEQDRMRPHIRFFINRELTRNLEQPSRTTDEIIIVQALSGG
jgi:molybdopterin synthase sulfur carrier subunit